MASTSGGAWDEGVEGQQLEFELELRGAGDSIPLQDFGGDESLMQMDAEEELRQLAGAGHKPMTQDNTAGRQDDGGKHDSLVAYYEEQLQAQAEAQERLQEQYAKEVEEKAVLEARLKMEVATLTKKLEAATLKAAVASHEAEQLQSQLDKAQTTLAELVNAVRDLAVCLDESDAAPSVTEVFHEVARATQQTMETFNDTTEQVTILVELQSQVHAACAADEVIADPESLHAIAAELERVSAAAERLQQELADSKQAVADSRHELAESREREKQLNSELQAAQTVFASLEAEVVGLQADQAQAAAKLQGSQEELLQARDQLLEAQQLLEEAGVEGTAPAALEQGLAKLDSHLSSIQSYLDNLDVPRDAPAPSARGASDQELKAPVPGSSETKPSDVLAAQHSLSGSGAVHADQELAALQAQLQALTFEHEGAMAREALLSSKVLELGAQLAAATQESMHASQQSQDYAQLLEAAAASQAALMEQLHEAQEAAAGTAAASDASLGGSRTVGGFAGDEEPQQQSFAPVVDDEDADEAAVTAAVRGLVLSSAPTAAEASSPSPDVAASGDHLARLTAEKDELEHQLLLLLEEKESAAQLLSKLGQEQELLSEQLRHLELDKAQLDSAHTALQAAHASLQAELQQLEAHSSALLVQQQQLEAAAEQSHTESMRLQARNEELAATAEFAQSERQRVEAVNLELLTALQHLEERVHEAMVEQQQRLQQEADAEVGAGAFATSAAPPFAAAGDLGQADAAAATAAVVAAAAAAEQSTSRAHELEQEVGRLGEELQDAHDEISELEQELQRSSELLTQALEQRMALQSQLDSMQQSSSAATAAGAAPAGALRRTTGGDSGAGSAGGSSVQSGESGNNEPSRSSMVRRLGPRVSFANADPPGAVLREDEAADAFDDQLPSVASGQHGARSLRASSSFVSIDVPLVPVAAASSRSLAGASTALQPSEPLHEFMAGMPGATLQPRSSGGGAPAQVVALERAYCSAVVGRAVSSAVQRSETEDQVAELQANMSLLQAEAVELAAQLQEAQSQAAEAAGLRQQMALLEAQAAEQAAQLQAHVDDLQSQVQQLQVLSGQLQEEAEQLKAHTADLEEQLHSAQAKASAADQAAALEAQISQLQGELECVPGLESNIAQLQAEAVALSAQLEDASGRVAELESQTGQLQEEVAALSAQLEAAQAAAASSDGVPELEALVAQLRKEATVLSEQLEAAQAAAASSGRVPELEAQVAQLQQETVALAAQLESAQAAAASSDRIAELEAQVAQLEEEADGAIAVQMQLAKLQADAGAAAALQLQVAQLQQDVGQADMLQAQVVQLQSEANDLAERLAKAQAAQEASAGQVLELQAQLEHLHAEKEALELEEQSLLATKSWMTDEIRSLQADLKQANQKLAAAQAAAASAAAAATVSAAAASAPAAAGSKSRRGSMEAAPAAAQRSVKGEAPSAKSPRASVEAAPAAAQRSVKGAAPPGTSGTNAMAAPAAAQRFVTSAAPPGSPRTSVEAAPQPESRASTTSVKPEREGSTSAAPTLYAIMAANAFRSSRTTSALRSSSSAVPAAAAPGSPKVAAKDSAHEALSPARQTKPPPSPAAAALADQLSGQLSDAVIAAALAEERLAEALAETKLRASDASRSASPAAAPPASAAPAGASNSASAMDMMMETVALHGELDQVKAKQRTAEAQVEALSDMLADAIIATALAEERAEAGSSSAPPQRGAVSAHEQQQSRGGGKAPSQEQVRSRFREVADSLIKARVAGAGAGVATPPTDALQRAKLPDADAPPPAHLGTKQVSPLEQTQHLKAELQQVALALNEMFEAEDLSLTSSRQPLSQLAPAVMTALNLTDSVAAALQQQQAPVTQPRGAAPGDANLPKHALLRAELAHVRAAYAESREVFDVLRADADLLNSRLWRWGRRLQDQVAALEEALSYEQWAKAEPGGGSDRAAVEALHRKDPHMQQLREESGALCEDLAAAQAQLRQRDSQVAGLQDHMVRLAEELTLLEGTVVRCETISNRLMAKAGGRPGERRVLAVAL